MRLLYLCLALPSFAALTTAQTNPKPENGWKSSIEQLGSESTEHLVAAVLRLKQAYPASRPHLVRSLAHRNKKVRGWIIKILGSTRDPRNAAVLARAARTEPIASYRIAALKSLKRLDQYDLRPILAERLRDEPDPANVKTILTEVAVRRAKWAIEPILDRLTFTYDRALRQRMFDTLRHITGLLIGDDPEAWRKWWERKRARARSKTRVETSFH